MEIKRMEAYLERFEIGTSFMYDSPTWSDSLCMQSRVGV